MPELRKDPIVGRWVIIAPDRAKRPQDLPPTLPTGAPHFCPFCEGNEDATPPEILAYRQPGTDGQRPRLADARRPQQVSGAAGRGEPQQARRRHLRPDERRRRPRGDHRVSRTTKRTCRGCRSTTFREVLWVYRDRLVDLKRDPPAGARPDLQEQRRAGRGVARTQPFAAHRHVGRADFSLGGNDRFARVLQLSRPLHLLRHDPAGAGDRQAHRARYARVSWCFVRSPAGFPSRPGSCPSSTPASTKIFRARESTSWGWYSKRSSVNWKWRLTIPRTITWSIPLRSIQASWHITIGTWRSFPGLTRVAGFEWGSGFYINPVLPEEAAEFLHDAEADVTLGAANVATST